MKKNIPFIISLLVIAGLIIWYFFFRKEPSTSPQISYTYDTDTVYVDRPFEVKVPFGIPTPPKTIYSYITDTTVLDSLKILLSEKDIIISGLNKEILISQDFVKQYPYHPKLLSLTVSRDTLVIGTLSTLGEAAEYYWPIDLTTWYYKWNIDNNLTRYRASLSNSNKPFAEYFVGTGMDFLNMSPYLSGRIEKDWSRIRLYGDAQIGLLKKEAHGLKIGLDYKLNGKGSNRRR